MTQKKANRRPNSDMLFDELLVTLAQGGDRRAAERLFRRWNPRLVRAARRYAGDAGLAEQLAQECWLGIWRGLPRLRDPASFPAWAFGIMRRRGAGSVMQAIARREENSLEEVVKKPHPPAQEDRAALNQAFASLPPDQRLAAHLHFVEGFTLRDIAQVQDVPEGTAKTRLFHARRKLKAALTASSEGEDQ